MYYNVYCDCGRAISAQHAATVRAPNGNYCRQFLCSECAIKTARRLYPIAVNNDYDSNAWETPTWDSE